MCLRFIWHIYGSRSPTNVHADVRVEVFKFREIQDIVYVLEIRFIDDSDRAVYGFLTLYISSTKFNTKEWVLKEHD